MLFDDNFSDIALAIAEGILDTLGINTPVVPLPDENEAPVAPLPDENTYPDDAFPNEDNVPVVPLPPRYTVQTGAFRNPLNGIQTTPMKPNDSAGSCPNLTFLPLSSRETDYTESW